MSGSSVGARGKRNGSVFILSCVRRVFCDRALHGRWLPAEQLCTYMHMKFNVGEDIKFTLPTMMRVINKVFPLTSSLEPNIIEGASGEVQLQVFRHTFQNRTRRYFFWVTAQVGVVPSLPSQLSATVWEQDHVLTRLLAGSREQPLEINMSIEPEPKRQKGLLPVAMASSLDTVTTDNASPAPLHTNTAESVLLTEVTANWWDSGDARRLFAPCTILYGTDCDVKEIVMERIEILESVNRAASNWKNVVDTRMGGTFKSHYSEADVFSLRYRSMYLALALKQFVLNVTGDLRIQWTWKRCLNYAIEAMNDIGVEFYSSFSTLSRWHRKFARHRYYFYKVPEAKTVCPRFFVDNPDAMEAFKNHGIANIKDLRVEMMLEYVHNELVPKLMVKRDGCLLNDDGDHRDAVLGEVEAVTPSTKEAFLQSYGLSSLSITTMARWMHACGFRYKKREKHYFVDGHERPETIAYRPVFTIKYLSYEIRAHRWLQMTLTESKELESKGSITKNCGFNYIGDDGIDMVEYHIDASYEFEERLQFLPFGGNLSVRKPIGSKTVIVLGQDEAIFKQFLFVTKMWVGPSGERPLLPKDEGTGTMISTFVCREHGLIREISAEILDEVNTQRAGQHYADPEAAIEILGNSHKRPLTPDKSPFLLFFEYGENREGYWAYNNMVLQFEDVIDVLKVMHPAYDFVFLFDHSAGHAKQRPDGLNQHRMNRSFGGKAAPMRSTIILREQGYLGTFPRILEPATPRILYTLPQILVPFGCLVARGKKVDSTNNLELSQLSS
ncbi:hypothetical protein MHU86_8325 [Fragilaria crotonensis]|nr:hypothetical protein MHU86_8325 [Fragilaria crotonensis]